MKKKNTVMHRTRARVPRMALALLLAMAMMTTVCTACAEGAVTEYQSDYFSFSFGGEAFEDMGQMIGDGILYAKPNNNPLSGSFIVEERGLNIDTATLNDVQLTVWYDLALKEFIGDDEESVNMETIEVEGQEARVFSYALSAQGMSLPAACVVVMRGSRMLIVSYFEGSGSTPEEVREKVKAAGETIRYLG